MKLIILQLLVLTLLSSITTIFAASLAYSNGITSPQRPPLRFNQNGKFKIVNFADLHYGEDPDSWGPPQDINSTKVMTDILEWEKPDLAVYTGDQITGDRMYPNATLYIDLLVKPLVDGNYKWASVYGNHDIGKNVSREGILATEQKYELSYTRHGEEGLPGVTNYFLYVYGPENEVGDDIPSLVLWFFDTRGGHNATHDIPANVDEKVVEWFLRENKKITKTWGRLPALAFFHIPTIEYVAVQETISENPKCTGLVEDTVVPQDKDTGFMKALVESGTVKTAFVGHDHGNAWCCYYDSLEICYNRHSGYGGYGEWTKGSRVVEASYNDPWGNYKNYIRLEDGTVIDHFPKN